jgi:hypothetical protein
MLHTKSYHAKYNTGTGLVNMQITVAGFDYQGKMHYICGVNPHI